MKLNEWYEVCGLSYNEFVTYLNNKYGRVCGNYYDLKADGALKKGTAGVKGYYIHHVKENEVSNLCDRNVAARNPIEYQHAENLVQSDILEHFFLHTLISEEFDASGDLEVGEGGICWIATTINMKINKGELSKEEYQVFLKLVNRYCTSSFIRQKHGKTPEDLLKRLLGQCSKVKHYSDYIEAVKDTKLFPWNINAFSDVRNYLRNNRTAGVVICTGGGKTTFGLELLRVFNWRGLILGPSNTIGTGWEGNPDKDRFNYEYMNYQTFQNDFTKIDYSKYDVIICDEMHHTEAPRWGEGLQYALDNTNVKIVGLTATPTDDQKQGNDKYFAGRMCYGLDLATGIREGHIHKFDYISAIYKLDRELFEKYGEAGRQMLGRLDLELNKNPIHKILKDNMPQNTVRKIIVFVQEKEMIDEAKEIMIKYNPNYATEEYARTIYSGLDEDYIKEAKNWFNKDHDHDVVLFTINMANEGAHFDGINTLIMFRKTNSSSLYLQQLGRIVVTSNKEDPSGIVFDFTNNAQTLINKPQVVVKKVKETAEAIEDELSEEDLFNEDDRTNTDISDEQVIADIQNAIKEQAEKTTANKGRVVIYKDYTEDCAETLAALYDSQKRSNTDAQIYVELQDELLNDPSFIELWKELKIEAAGRLLISTKRSKNKSTTTTAQAKKEKADEDKEHEVRQTVLASDAERLATVYKLLVKRAYISNAIDFEDDVKAAVKVLDNNMLATICKQLGIKCVDIIIRAMNNLAKLTFILAVNL